MVRDHATADIPHKWLGNFGVQRGQFSMWSAWRIILLLKGLPADVADWAIGGSQ
jgi:hypothetical protein